jgi:hypothetical protein
MLGSRTLGPRDENCAITGDGWTSTTVLDRWRTAVGLELELMYLRMVTALAADTAVPGRTCASRVAENNGRAARALHLQALLHP